MGDDSERGFVMMDEPAAAEDANTAPDGLPKIDFATFVLSLGTSALFHLGEAPDPVTGEANPEPNTALARQTVDTLEMLEAKTRGNLEPEEAKLIESLLYEIRMRIVKTSR
jgi:hypothetical protein